MPSRDNLRAAIEWALRGVMLAALATAIVTALQTLRDRPALRGHGGTLALRDQLSRWSTAESPDSVHVTMDSVPAADVRDWIAAMPAAGTAVTWDGPGIAPAAIVIDPVVDPARKVRVWIAAPAGMVTVGDSLGVIDSVSVRRQGSVLSLQQLDGVARMTSGATVATAARIDSVIVRPVLVLASAGWEAKFLVSALEEHGWKVDARLPIAKTGQVIQGPATVTIDTGRYAAVIALDSTAQPFAGQIERYVRSGGGFIAAGEAATGMLADLMPGSASFVRPSEPLATDTVRPRRTLALAPLGQLRRDAVVIETLDNAVAVAGRRIARGRVLQVGYAETWRWRLGGAGDPAGAHRRWWSAMVSSVAYAPRVPLASTAAESPAPLASLVGTLGPPSRPPGTGTDFLADPRVRALLFAVILGALLLETASRRLRGRP